MKSLSNILMVVVVFASTVSLAFAQNQNITQVNVKINGVCHICKAAIEKAGNVKNTAQVNWNEHNKRAAISYNKAKTNINEILKRIALAGYDNELYLAPEQAYANLADCCKYKRDNKQENLDKQPTHHSAATVTVLHHQETDKADPKNDALKTVSDNYFALADALVKTDKSLAATKSKQLLNALNMVTTPNKNIQTAWSKHSKKIMSLAEQISKSKNITQQRSLFHYLSTGMYELLKAADYEHNLYYMHCPMFDKGKGANWLSKEKEIKNPYYGSQMLTCGNIKETINE